MANPLVSQVSDKNGSVYDIAAKQMDGNRSINMTGDVNASQATDFSGETSIATTIAAGAVGTNKLADEAVTNAKLGDQAVTLDKIADTSKATSISSATGTKLVTEGAVVDYVDTIVSGQSVYKGSQTVATINGWTSADLHNGDKVLCSDAGTITLGSVTARAGDMLIFYKSGDTAIWQNVEGDNKQKQDAVTLAGAAGKTWTKIYQNENGDIDPDKCTAEDIKVDESQVEGLEGDLDEIRADVKTLEGKTKLSDFTDDITTSTYSSTGTAPVNGIAVHSALQTETVAKATADASGNNIVNTYATKTESALKQTAGMRSLTLYVNKNTGRVRNNNSVRLFTFLATYRAPIKFDMTITSSNDRVCTVHVNCSITAGTKFIPRVWWEGDIEPISSLLNMLTFKVEAAYMPDGADATTRVNKKYSLWMIEDSTSTSNQWSMTSVHITHAGLLNSLRTYSTTEVSSTCDIDWTQTDEEIKDSMACGWVDKSSSNYPSAWIFENSTNHYFPARITPGTAVGSSTSPVYVDSVGQVTACGSSLDVDISGTAAKATADASGNNIVNTYATKAALEAEVTRAEAAETSLSANIATKEDAFDIAYDETNKSVKIDKTFTNATANGNVNKLKDAANNVYTIVAGKTSADLASMQSDDVNSYTGKAISDYVASAISEDLGGYLGLINIEECAAITWKKGDWFVAEETGTYTYTVDGTAKTIALNEGNEVYYTVDGKLEVKPTSTYEKVANKVTTLDSGVTDTQYPSAKAVYGALSGKQNTLTFMTAAEVDTLWANS